MRSMMKFFLSLFSYSFLWMCVRNANLILLANFVPRSSNDSFITNLHIHNLPYKGFDLMTIIGLFKVKLICPHLKHSDDDHHQISFFLSLVGLSTSVKSLQFSCIQKVVIQTNHNIYKI